MRRWVLIMLLMYSFLIVPWNKLEPLLERVMNQLGCLVGLICFGLVAVTYVRVTIEGWQQPPPPST